MSSDRDAQPLSRLLPPGLQLCLLLGFAALTALMLWPLPLKMGSHVLQAIYYWDAYTNTMLLSSRVQGLFGSGPLGVYDSYFFAPIENSIVFNENLFGLSLLYAPLLFLSGNPLLSYNLTLFISFILSQYFMYLLVLRLSGNRWAGILSGFAFALSPYATYEMGRIQLAAQQWIPLCIWFACRAFEERRWRDVCGLALSYVLLVGTCLYYAMFLAPLLCVLAAVLLLRNPPSTRFWLKLLAAGALAAGLSTAMIAPYFSARKNFDLQRTAQFAQRFDGDLSFFFNVHSTNRTWTLLHHHTEATEHQALEQIAFPGATIFFLCALALLLPLVAFGRKHGMRALLLQLMRWLCFSGVALGITLLTHSMLWGVALPLAALAIQHVLRTRSGRPPAPSPYPFVQRLHIALLLLAIGLFLGMQPWSLQGEPVHGLYYYLYKYVPGMDGIRKVSRQACMTTLWFALLASFGLNALLKNVQKVRLRALITFALLATLVFEVRTFPHPLQAVWAGDHVPPIYSALAAEPRETPVAITPVNFGSNLFRGHHGMALHNYMAVYHDHRTVNGKSSYIPPATHLATVALSRLPHPVALGIIRQLGAGYLLVHGEEYPQQSREFLLHALDALDGELETVFKEGDQRLYRFVHGPLSLQATPALPVDAVSRSGRTLLAANASVRRGLRLVSDGQKDTMWSTRRAMRRGDFIELSLQQPAQLALVELRNSRRPIDLPVSYKVEVAAANGGWQTVVERPELQLYRDQVHRPRNFSLRIPLPTEPRAQRIRISVMQPVPRHAFSIEEAVVWIRK